MRTSLRLVAAAGAALLLAACGGDDDDATTDATEIELEEVDDESSGELHACDLLTDDEIEAQLAASESEGQETSGEYTIEHEEMNTDAGYSSCSYHWETVDRSGGTPQARGDFQVELVLAERIEPTRAEFGEDPIAGVEGADEAFLISGAAYAVVDDLAIVVVNLQRGDDASIGLLQAAVAGL